MTLFHIAALALAATAARAAPLVSRDCASVPGPDPNVRDQIYQVALSRGLTADSLCMEVMFCTAITESDVNNLPCGDQDSLGVFQQRPSQGWGTHDQLLDVNYSTNKFLDVAIPLCNSEPNADAGDIAQQVQNAQAGNRYTQNEGEARQLIAEAKASVGDGGSNPPPTSSGDGGASNVGATPTTNPQPSPTDGGNGDCSCSQTYSPQPGDTCSSVANMFNISLQDFYNWNPEIDSDCQNLDVGQDYCVAE